MGEHTIVFSTLGETLELVHKGHSRDSYARGALLAAKFLAAEAANKACRQAMITHGGFGYAKEYHVERLARESMIPVLAPIGQALVLSYIGERVLNLPKSY